VSSRGGRSARLAAVLVVALLTLAVVAPVAGASRSPRTSAPGGGLGSPLSDSTAPQIPVNARVVVVRSWVERAISLRLLALSSAHAQATAPGALTAADRSVILGVIAADRSGLRSLALSVRSEGAVAGLQTSIDSVIDNFRVYSVLVPQVDTAIAVDAVSLDVRHIARSESEIAAAVATASALGDSGAINQVLSALVSVLTEAKNLLATTHSAVMTLGPPSFPQSAEVFVAANQALISIRADVITAETDIQKIAKLLRNKFHESTLGSPKTS
jgi:hypothetical protein